jgi:hypothetical protein
LQCVAAATRGAGDRDIPGASARKEFQRRHDARERDARERLGRLGVGLARLSGDPNSTQAWLKGAEGEAKVARALARRLQGKQVELLHDRLMPGSRRANIDHLAIGRGGVTVIDSKNLKGEVRVQTVGGWISARQTLLRVNGRDQTKLIRGVERQAEAVSELLRSVGLQAEVRAALCFATPDGLPLWRKLEVDGVLVDGPRRVAELAARPGTLTAEQRQQILRELALLLMPAA